MTDAKAMIARVKELYGDGQRCVQSDPYSHVLKLAHDLAVELEKIEPDAELYRQMCQKQIDDATAENKALCSRVAELEQWQATMRAELSDD